MLKKIKNYIMYLKTKNGNVMNLFNKNVKGKINNDIFNII